MNKLSNRICLLLAALGILAGSVTAYAETSSAAISAEQSNRTVKGVVLDSQDYPLVGVAVIQDGTTNGVMTDENGSFTITLPAGATNVTVTCLGYATKNMTVPSGQDVIKIYLSEDAVALDETVVVGYGTQKKVNLTGAIATVSSKDLENRTSATLTHMLMGTTPGLNVTMSSGRPGNSASINIRGVNSINSANPLVLIDGTEGDLSKINPADVESISVIKDASAAAVYGARASYGVVLVTTKSGESEEGKATVRYSGRFGWTEPTTSTDFETRGYYSVYLNDLFMSRYNGKNYTYYTEADMEQLWARRNDVVENPERPWVMIDQRAGRDTYVYYANTDWYHELFKDQHPQQQHNLSLSGGNKYMKYFVSAGYNYEEGVVRINPDKLNKVNFRAKVDFDINKYMRLSNNTSYYRSSYFYPGRSSVNQIFSLMTVHALASYPAYNPDGTALAMTHFADNNYIMDGMWAVLANNGHGNKDINDNLFNTTELTIKPFKQLEIKANFTYGFNQTRCANRAVQAEFSRYPGVIQTVSGRGWAENYLYESINTHTYYSTNVYATYADTFKENHNLKVMAGFNWEQKDLKDMSATGYYLMSETLQDFNLVGTGADGNKRVEIGGGHNVSEIAGIFARINYDYKGKYLFEVSGRYDGTSRFAPDSRWGSFPSASAGWRISEEPFFQPAKKAIENLKVRYSYGNLGNQQMSSYYPYIRTITPGTQTWIFGTASEATTATIGAPVAQGLTWETTEQHNLGVDMAFLNNRLSFTGEVYMRNTNNMLTAGEALPAVYGAAVPQKNVADLSTKGYELMLVWKDVFQLAGKPFSYNVTATFSDYVTDVTRYKNDDKTFALAHYEGKRWGEIWGYCIDGLFASDAEAKEYTTQIKHESVKVQGFGEEANWRGGDLKFIDLNGDGKINLGQNRVGDPGDRKVIGNTQPRYNYGLNLGFQWMGFDFSIFFQGIGKMDYYPVSNTIMFWGPFARPYATLMPRDFHTMLWTEENKDAYFPRARGYSANNSNNPLNVVNDRYLQDISYCRLKNLTVGYTLPKKWTDKINVGNVRFYFSGENLHYWAPGFHSDYIDPEMAQTGASTMRIYPWQKSFIFGVDLSF